MVFHARPRPRCDTGQIADDHAAGRCATQRQPQRGGQSGSGEDIDFTGRRHDDGVGVAASIDGQQHLGVVWSDQFVVWSDQSVAWFDKFHARLGLMHRATIPGTAEDTRGALADPGPDGADITAAAARSCGYGNQLAPRWPTPSFAPGVAWGAGITARY